MVILISYDATEERVATALGAAVEKTSASHLHLLNSHWLVETNDPVELWTQRLQAAIGAEGQQPLSAQFFIVEVRRPFQGWLDQAVWDWLLPRVRPGSDASSAVGPSTPNPVAPPAS